MNEERLYSVTMTEEELRLFSEFIEQREFGAKSAVLGMVSPGSWVAKEAAKYAYEDDPEEYEKKKKKYAFRGFLAPTAASYQLERARYLKKKGYTPEEIREDIEGSKTTGIALGADLIAAPITAPVHRAGGGYIHGLVHKYGREEERKKINKSVKKDKSSKKEDKKKD